MATSRRSSAPATVSQAPVQALVGADSFLQQQALEALLRDKGPDTQRSDLEGASADPAEVFDDFRSFAMFGGSRLVVVRNADEFISKHREAVEAFLEGLGSAGESVSGNLLVLRCNTLAKNTRVYKLISKVGAITSVEAPAERDLPRWIMQRGKQAHGIDVAANAATLLADLIGSDLGTIDGELGKLALQADGGRVTPDMIAGGVAFRREQEMWAMTDALAAGRPQEALRVWRQLLATDSSAEFRAVTWLGMWLEKSIGALRLAAQGRNSYAIAQAMKIWPASNAEPLIRTARAMGEGRLRRATDRLAEIDFRTKSGLGDASRAVEAFILTASTQAGDLRTS